jgi:ATP-binding cassette subfamily F protein 3
MRSKEILKNALINFTGTVLVVSHDRDFLDGLVDCIYEFKNKKTKQHLGGIYDFLRKKKIESLKELEIKTASKGKDTRPKNSQDNGLSFEERKDIGKNITKLEKRVEQTELEIALMEDELKKMDTILSSSVELTDHSIFERYDKLKAKLEETMESWEMEHKELENWKSKKTW